MTDPTDANPPTSEDLSPGYEAFLDELSALAEAGVPCWEAFGDRAREGCPRDARDRLEADLLGLEILFRARDLHR